MVKALLCKTQLKSGPADVPQFVPQPSKQGWLAGPHEPMGISLALTCDDKSSSITALFLQHSNHYPFDRHSPFPKSRLGAQMDKCLLIY